jgi:hypothetical protein
MCKKELILCVDAEENQLPVQKLASLRIQSILSCRTISCPA